MDSSKRTFYLITFGELISNIGDRFQKIAFPILIYNITQSSAALSSMVIIEMLPQLFLGFIMGYILDRYNRKLSMCIATLIQMVLCLSIPFIHKYDGDLWLYYIIAFSLPAFAIFFQTSFSVVLPTLFSKNDLQKFNSQFQTVRTFSKLLSPGIAGMLMTKISIDFMFVLNGLTFLVLFIILIISKIPEIEINEENEKLSTIFNGFIINFKNYYLRIALLFTIVINICMVGFNSSIIYYLKSELMLNDQLIGIVYSISGLGSLLGAVCLSTILKDKSVMKTLTMSMLLIPVFVITSAIFNNWIIFAISYACMSFMITVASVSITTLQQQQSDEQNLGKVLSSAFVISMTLAPLGGFISSSVSANYSSSFSLIVLGTGALVLVVSIFIINLRKYKQVRK